MASFDIVHILKQFNIDNIIGINEISSGHINATYRVDTPSMKYLLQRVNTSVFECPEKMMENIKLVLSLIPRLKLFETVDGRPYYSDETGFYRVYNFIENSVSYDRIDSVGMAERMAQALRSFHSALSSLDGSKLFETIPRFHDMVFRFSEFEKAIEEDRGNRRSKVKKEVEWMFSERERVSKISDLYKEGALPVRVTHNDTKLSNILFDRATGEYITFIDLDTVMPGTILFDIGDMIRTGCTSALEDEADLDKVHFKREYLEAMKRGYLDNNGDVTELEASLFEEAGRTITFIIALRFLTDYINGDTYYRVDYEEHNLVRTRNQIRLIEEMDKEI